MNRIVPPHARLIFPAFLLLVLGTAAQASAGVITLAWDPSPSPGVIGYRVYVGTEPGVYSQTFDVGRATWFVYQAPDSRQYHLAVAAYAAGAIVGPLSAPVSAYPRDGSAWPDAQSFYESIWRSSPSASAATPARTVLRSSAPAGCWIPSDCFVAQTLVRSTAPLSSLATAHDGRFFFIENNQKVAVVESRVLQPILTIDSPTQLLTQITLDPQFASTGFVYVGEVDTRPDGEREFRIARYRLVRNQAEERSLVLSVPVPSSGEPLFTVASAGHLYVALPEVPNEHTPYSGTVLRFNLDGTIPPGQRNGSPVLAAGYASPTAIAFDEEQRRLWLAGLDADNQPSLLNVAENLSESVAWPVSPESTPLAVPLTSIAAVRAPSGSHLFVTTAAGRLGKAQVGQNGVLTSTTQVTVGSGLAQAVATTSPGSLLTMLASQLSDGSELYSILRLTPAR